MLFFSTLVVRSSSRKANIHSEDTSCASNFSISLRSCASITSANLRPTYNIWSSLSIFHSIKSENRSKTEVGSIPYGYYTTTLVYSETYPKFMLIIKCSKEKNLTFIAEEIKNNLRKKYNIVDKE